MVQSPSPVSLLGPLLPIPVFQGMSSPTVPPEPASQVDSGVAQNQPVEVWNHAKGSIDNLSL